MIPPQVQQQQQQQQQIGRPPRVASMQPQDFNQLQQGMNGLNLSSSGSNQRVNYYASPEEGPPHKLSVTHPDVSPSFASLLSECLI